LTWAESAYEEVLIRTAGPERMCHLQQRMAQGGEMPEAARKERHEMSAPSRGGPQYETKEWLEEWEAHLG